MNLRPRLSIPLQLTGLAILITTLAVFVTSTISHATGRIILREDAVVDLGDKTNLWLFEIQNTILAPARELRALSTNVGRFVRDTDPDYAQTNPADVGSWFREQVKDSPELAAIWKDGIGHILQPAPAPRTASLVVGRGIPPARRRTPLHFDQGWVAAGVERVQLVWVPDGQPPQVLGETVVEDGIPSGLKLPVGKQVWSEDLRQQLLATRQSQHPIADTSGFLLESSANPRCRLFLSRRIAVGPPFDTVQLAITFDINDFIRGLACRLPRHVFFLLDGNGRFLHHPDESFVGKELDTDHLFSQFSRAGWKEKNQQAVADDLLLTGGVQAPDIRVSALTGSRLPGVDYYSTRKPWEGDSKQATRMAQELTSLLAEDEDLRCSRIHRLSRFIELSHPDQGRLIQAQNRISALEQELLGKPGPAWNKPIHCRHFVAHMVPVTLPMGGRREPARLVVAASVEEIEEGVRTNTMRTRYWSLLLVLGVSSVLALALAYYLTHPLRSIVIAARRLAEGDYGVTLPNSGPQEVVQLATSFRYMLTQIQQRDSRLNQTLEEMRGLNLQLDARVRERTAELELSMNKLEMALDQARSASRAKDTFVANMSHELRQPLHIIIGFTEALREEAERFNNPGVIPDLDKVLAAARHLLDLINDILDLAKVSAGKMELSLTEFAVPELVRSVQALVEPLVARNRNRFEVVLEEVGRMKADEKRVKQILINLLSNAAKFTRDGVITFRADREQAQDEEWVRFSIRDTGKGMTPEQLKQLFGRFYQADDSTRREQGGTGLGLAITKSLCDLMGGRIEVSSEPEHGSEFIVWLPVQPHTGKETPGSWRPTVPARKVHTDTEPEKKRVLVIDDDPSVRDLMERFLSKQGFVVMIAPNGEDGLRLAKTNRPDIITLDVMMPGVDGWGVLAALKTDAVTRDIPVVMVTIVDDQSRGFSLGATDYVTKPIDWHRLGDLLHHHIDRQGADGPILVVDDEPAHLEMMSRMLASRGREVVTASNGQEALEKFQSYRPVLILLDLMMPVMDGFEFLDQLQDLDPQHKVPVIVITAKDLTPEDCKRLNGGVAQVLQKGTLQQLEQIVQQIRDRLMNFDDQKR